MSVSISHPTDRPNFSRVTLGILSIWFSYETPIAFSDGWDTTVSENLWSTTTGKHLNYIDNGDKDKRLPRAEFVEALNARVQRGV